MPINSLRGDFVLLVSFSMCNPSNSIKRSAEAVAETIWGKLRAKPSNGPCICPTSCKNAVNVPKLEIPFERLIAPKTNAIKNPSRYPRLITKLVAIPNFDRFIIKSNLVFCKSSMRFMFHLLISKILIIRIFWIDSWINER